MGIAIEIVGLVIFLGAHVFVTMRGHRAKLIAQIGVGAYKGAFTLVSLVGLFLICYGFARYRSDGFIQVWYPPPWTRYIVEAAMWPASIALVAVNIWAVAHLCANGDLGGMILFGSVLAWAVYDRITLKRRTDAGSPPIPIGGRRNDVIAVVVGTIVYLALGLVFHPIVIGVPVFGPPALGQ
jgi:uncharacterized membrane protein